MKVVIVGAGLAGSVLANSLSKSCHVTVIEKGPEQGFSTCDEQGLKLASVPTFCFGQGGTTNLWHNGLINLDIEAIEDPVLNAILRESSLYLNEAAQYLGYQEDLEIENLPSFSFSHHLSSKALYYPDVQTTLKLENGVERYFDVDEFEIVNNKLLFDNVELKFDKLIFCCGGLSTVNLISKHFGIVSDNSFIDHPMGFLGKIKVKKENVDLFKKIHEYKTDKGTIKSALILESKGRKSAIYLRPSGCIKNSLTTNKYKSLLGASSGFNRLKNAINFNILRRDIISEIFNKIFKVQLFPRHYSIMMVCDQKTRTNVLDDGTVRLEIDNQELALFRDQLSEFGSAISPYCEDVKLVSDFDSKWLWSAAHHSGALPAKDFINEDLKLNGYDNIYICDASILSEHQYANTGLTLASLALYLSNRLKNENSYSRF